MTGDTKHRTLKDQLESEIADMERDASEDPEKYNGQPLVGLKLEPYRLISVYVGNLGVIRPPEPVIRATGDFP
jgi:hypothetical protein